MTFWRSSLNRRKLLKTGLVAMASLAAVKPVFSLQGAEDFSEELYAELLASGNPFLLDFTATW